MRARVGLVALSLILAACGDTTADVVIDTIVEDWEIGSFEASGDLFGCEGRWATLEISLNEGDSWWFEDEYVCDDGSGTLVLRTAGVGPEPEVAESVGTWTVISGTGDYEGFAGEGTYGLMVNPWSERFVGELTSG